MYGDTDMVHQFDLDVFGISMSYLPWKNNLCLAMCYNCIGLDGKRWENMIVLITVSGVSQSVKS